MSDSMVDSSAPSFHLSRDVVAAAAVVALLMPLVLIAVAGTTEAGPPAP